MSQLFKSFDASEKTQLICFPFAGGYSASFRPLHAFCRGVRDARCRAAGTRHESNVSH